VTYGGTNVNDIPQNQLTKTTDKQTNANNGDKTASFGSSNIVARAPG